MPFRICQKHGGNLAPHACKHIMALLSEQKPLGKISLVDLDNVILVGWVCGKCLDAFNEKGLQAYLESRKGKENYPEDEELDPFLKLLDGWGAACPKCLSILSEIPEKELLSPRP